MGREATEGERGRGGEGGEESWHSFSLGFLLSSAKNDLYNHLDLEDF